MNNTTKGILIGVILVLLVIYLAKPEWLGIKKPEVIPGGGTPPPPPPPPAETQVKIINVTPAQSQTFNWDSLDINHIYRAGGRYLKGYSKPFNTSCAPTQTVASAGTGFLYGSGSNSCWYRFIANPGVILPPPPPPPSGEMAM